MEIWQVTLAILGSSALTIILTKFFDRKKTTAEVKQISAEETKLLAEARQINADTDNTVSEGWKQIAENLKLERGKLLERISDLEKMLVEEDKLNKLKQDKLRIDCNNLVIEVRQQLHIERERYDNRISEIIKQILETKI